MPRLSGAHGRGRGPGQPMNILPIIPSRDDEGLRGVLIMRRVDVILSNSGNEELSA